MFGFGKKKPESAMSEASRRLVEMLGCPFEYFPEGSNPEVIVSAYYEALAKREIGGYTPLIIVPNDTLLEMIGLNIGDAGSLEEKRAEILESNPFNVKAWFVGKLAEHQRDFGEHWSSAVGEMTGEPGAVNDTFSGIVRFGTKKSEECILAKIPVINPWEVIAWLPFGDWNECPKPEEIMWICKYWYEKHGAVPAVMTDSILEFSAGAVTDKTAAMDLALEQSAFCEDIVSQGVGTIGRLADLLTESGVWYFWWD